MRAFGLLGQGREDVSATSKYCWTTAKKKFYPTITSRVEYLNNLYSISEDPLKSQNDGQYEKLPSKVAKPIGCPQCGK